MTVEPEYLEADPQYIRDRNALIPEAEKFTNKHCGKTYTGDKKNIPAREKWAQKWTRIFMRRMDTLYAQFEVKKGAPSVECTSDHTTEYTI